MQSSADSSRGLGARNLDLLEARPRLADLRRAVVLLGALPTTRGQARTRLVLTNMVALVAQGEAEDYEQTAALTRRYGHEQVASLQSELDGRIGSGPNVPFVTGTIVRLARTTQIEDTLIAAGRARPDARRTARTCATAAFWLLMADIDPRHPAPVPRTRAQVRQLVETRGADAWREVLANIAANPWGPVAVELAEIVRDAGHENPAQAIDRCAAVFRSRAEDAERLEIAREIRRLVAVSGCSQREFARYVGTSASRLSTYIHGGVTPSATMMLRIVRLSAELARS